MGGEPTFVSADDRDGAEWNTSALGPTKRLLAGDLLWRLRKHYGDGGFVHFGQGKWYPGEQLPRWALGCYWRRDGEPTWRDASLFADEHRDYGYGSAGRGAFSPHAGGSARRDGRLHPGRIRGRLLLFVARTPLPVNVDPFEAKLDDEMERERLRRVFLQKLDTRDRLCASADAQ